MARTLTLLLAMALWPPPGLAQESAGLAQVKLAVKPRAYVSLEPVPRGRIFELAVVAQIERGFHINANKVLDPYLIPTLLEVKLPEGFRLLETDYPPGKLRKFAFAEEKLAVYSGRATLRMRIEAGADAPLGGQKLPLVLRYQACNNTMCFPPMKLPVEIEVKIVRAGAQAKSIHPAIFGNHPPSAKK